MTNESLSLKGKVALVTGASRGIGRAIAIEFAQAGADIILAARSTEASPSKLPGTIEHTAGEIETMGRRVLCVRTDVSNDEQVEAMAERTLQEFGWLDILVNNAAYNYNAPFHEMAMKRWDLVMNVNLRGVVLCTKAFLPSMMERRSGAVLNISSGSAVTPLPSFAAHPGRPMESSAGMLAYSVSKAALEQFTRGLAGQMIAYNIAVNALRPGAVLTEGAAYLNPDVDLSGMRKLGEPSQAALWVVTRPSWYTGNLLDITDVEAITGVSAETALKVDLVKPS